MLYKFLISLTFLLCTQLGLRAASYDIQLSASTQNSTCYTDGRILVKLAGADFGQLASSDQFTFNVQKNGKSYKQHDLTRSDMRADSVFVLEGYPTGIYTIDYSIWLGSQTEIKGNIPSFKLSANVYLEPAVFQTLGDNKMMQGTRPSLNCKPTGRIQLEIVQGKFPYTVQVFKDGAFLRNDVFKTRMHSGLNPLLDDYLDYYDIEQLGIGSYTFTVTDSCGYQLTMSESILVEDVNFKCIPAYASYSSYTKQQVVFKLLSGFFNNIKYDKFSDQWLEYRFAAEGETFGAWKPFSTSDMVVESSPDSVFGKTYKFELRIKDCPSYPVCYSDVLIPNKVPAPTICQEKISPSVILIPIPGTGTANFCACDGGTKDPILFDKWQVKTDFTVCDPYTLPLTYKWTNEEYPQYSYQNTNINSSALAYLSPQYALAEENYGNNIHFELTDATGHVYLDTVILIPPKPKPPQPTPPTELKWTAGHNITGATACSGIPLGTVSLNVDCGNIPDNTLVEMTQTPNGYSFTAQYDLANRTWNFVPSSLTDFYTKQSTYSPIGCTSSISIGFSDLFRFGNYKFVVKWKNLRGQDTTTTVIRNIPNNFARFGISEDLSFTTKKTCQGMLYYPKAQVLSWIYGDDGNKTAVPVKFRVFSGNITGYEINGGAASVGFCNKDSMLITKPGRYIIQSFYNPSGANSPDATIAECTVCTDTIDYVIQTLSFEDYYGYLCADTRSSIIRGSVTVIAKDASGVPPYRYDLYSGTDTKGKLIGSNASGVFSDISVTSANFYVRVEDKCRSSFVVAIPLSPVITTDAVFGDRSVCLGSVARLQGKMLGATNQVSYLWTGADGFSSTNRQVITQAILQPSTFYLEISGLGCRILDSITVQPVDKINISYEDLICQGTNYDGGKEYLQAISTAHLPVGEYHYSVGPVPAVKGACDSTTNLTLRIINENSVLEDTVVMCDNEFPVIWQDTVFTEGAASGVYYLPKRVNNCSYKLALRLNVYHPTDIQVDRLICEGESVIFNGKTFTESGYYPEHFVPKTACDSLVTLHLTVASPNQTTVEDSIYQDENYTLNGFSLPVQRTDGSKYELLMLKNRYGCDSTVYLKLTVLSSAVTIPEVFSPNGDDKNAFFRIKNIERYPRNHIMIFNRWGNLMYDGKPYMNQWDGKNYFNPKVGGNDLPVGTYFYILDLGDGSEAIRGYIYLNR